MNDANETRAEDARVVSDLDDMVGETPELRDADDAEQQTMKLAQRFERNLVDEIQRLEHAEKIIKRRAAMLTTMRIAGIGDTDPEHWVLHRSPDGAVIGIPSSPACARMAKLYGIKVFNLRPRNDDDNFEPAKIPVRDDTETEFRGFCDARSQTTGEEIEDVEFSRRTDEKFIGRYDDMSAQTGAWEGDMRKAVSTGLRSKSVRILTGTGKVSFATLKACFDEAGKDSTMCVKGHGFGSSSDRGASGVTDESTKDAGKKLGDEIMRRVGGDKDAAADLLEELTTFTNREGKVIKGIRSIARMTSAQRANIARSKLAEHPTFGDNAANATNGATNGEGAK